MVVLLWVFALFIFFTYSFYFFKIILGKPEEFEIELLKSLANWMVNKGVKARSQLWWLFFLSVALEIVYFTLVFVNVTQPVLLIITSFFAGVEIIHLITVGISFSKFFGGKIVLKDLLNWKVERLSGLLFFTHTFLVMVCLAFF